ncbi:MAG: HlyD family efflux transporter periplasmic adaptor subunit [Bacteroidales bacterium]|nr:HlyD family efflux transporter periplasmic adaptor subunit [Bacteroidales bacterium]
MDEVELRSEEVQEVLGEVPHWILRWGLFIIATILLNLFVGSWLFKYPDIISGTMTLTSLTPPVSIVSKTNGRLKELYVGDKSSVKMDEYLAVIENPASTEDMITLKNKLTLLKRHPDSVFSFDINSNFQLGNVQETFTSFIRSLSNYQIFIEQDYYPKKLESLYKRLQDFREYYIVLKRQQDIVEEQLQISTYRFQRDSMLLMKECISPKELEDTKTKYLQSRFTIESSNVELEALQISMSELQEMILDNEQQYLEKKNRLVFELTSNITSLTNEINAWEMSYVLVAPITGQITFSNYWVENQNVVSGEIVFSIIPREEQDVLGRALLPIARSGKVKRGQEVNIYLDNYPDKEFGIVKGTVREISLVPINNFYTLEINLPDGLFTSYKKKLPFSQEMSAKIEIITDDLRLIERILLPLKQLLKNQ